MMLIGLARLGRDVTLRYMPDSTPVANMALAFNYGKKDADGNRPTQWVDAALFGPRAEKLGQYLLKGTPLNIHVSDVHIETYPKTGGGEGVKLVGFVQHIEFAGSAPQQQGQAATAGARPAAPQGQRPTSADDDFNDSIPF